MWRETYIGFDFLLSREIYSIGHHDVGEEGGIGWGLAFKRCCATRARKTEKDGECGLKSKG